VVHICIKQILFDACNVCAIELSKNALVLAKKVIKAEGKIEHLDVGSMQSHARNPGLLAASKLRYTLYL
jgi:hypothetical protein